MKPGAMKTICKRLPEIVLSVLGYRDEAQWVALALEIDLRGYGSTLDEAIQDLSDLIGMQIGFAYFKGQPEMIWKNAEPTFFQLFAQLRARRSNELDQDSTDDEFAIPGLPIPSAHVIESMRTEYRQTN